MASNDTDDNETYRLCDFPRRNKQTGKKEKLRIESSHWNGRVNLNARLWYEAKRPSNGDDGYRPSTCGVTFREDEIDTVIEALQFHKRLIESEGRSTSSGHPGDTIRPVTVPPRQPAQTASTTRGPGREGSRDAAPWEADDIQDIF